MRSWLFLLAFLIVTTLGAQQLPGNEIYLFDLTKRKNDFVLSGAENVTNHPGYDNQPFFHPNKPIVYYASANDDGKTDIIAFNYKTKHPEKLTNTSEREYSPTVTP